MNKNKSFLDRIAIKIGGLSTYKLLSWIYLIFFSPFLLLVTWVVIFVIPNNLEIGGDISRTWAFLFVALGWLGCILGGVVIIARKEYPAYMPFRAVHGKSALAIGIVQIILSVLLLFLFTWIAIWGSYYFN